MRRSIHIIAAVAALLLLPLSCRQPVRGTASGAGRSCFDVLLDTTATFPQVQAAVLPWADRLRRATADTASLQKRLTAQQFAYITIELLASQVSRLGKTGEDIPYEEFNALMNPLLEAANQWLHTTEDGLTSVWRDMYYASGADTDTPEGYFHIMVALPDDEASEPELHIFFPESARGNPRLIFRKYKDYETLEEDIDNQEVVPLENWYGKGELDTGYPMYASAGADIVEKMLGNDLMYILFDPEGTARVGLMYFQEKYTEAVGFD